MNAQTIQDSVNKYRYGVKIGNYNEETFGRDKAVSENNWQIPVSTQKGSYRLDNTIYNVPQDQISVEEKEYNNLVLKNDKALKIHVLFGHGVTQEDFQNRQLTSSYDLSYNRKVTPQTQILPKYEPEKTHNALIAKKDQVTGKVTEVNLITSEDLNQRKQYIHYDEFTKHFDSNHIKIPLRR